MYLKKNRTESRPKRRGG